MARYAGPERIIMELRYYQSEVVSVCLDAIAARQRIIIALPTGTGKTVCFAETIRQTGLPTLVAAHTEELLGQAKNKIVAAGIPEDEVDIVQQSQPRRDARVWVASVQTLARGNRLAEIAPQLIVVDEAHHSCASTYRKILDYFPGVPALGFTATPTRKSRKEKALLASMWTRIGYQMSFKRAVVEGWLAPIEYYRISSGVSLDDVKTVGGEFDQGQLSAKVNVYERNRACVEKYFEVGGGKGIVFSVDLAHARALQAEFAAAGVRALYVSGETPKDERPKILAEFSEAGHNDNIVIANCGVLTEGYDCPDVRQIIPAKPVKSVTRYMQMIGRGTRPAPGKRACVIVDIADNYAKAGLCNCLRTVFNLRKDLQIEGDVLATLAGDAKKDPRELRTEKALDEAIEQRDVAIELANILFDMPAELESSKLAWYSPEARQYYCCVDRGKYLLVEDNDLSYDLFGLRGAERKPLMSSVDLKAIDRFARELCEKWYSSTWYMWDRSKRANWSNDRPTERQTALIAKIAPEINCTRISKATATEIISAHYARADREPATDKQLYFLMQRGVAVDDGLSKREASRLIAQTKGV